MNEQNKSLRDSLQETMAAFSETDGSPDEADTQAAATEAETPDDGQEPTVNEQGSEGADDSGEQESTAGEDADDQGIQAPATWSEEDRDAFVTLAPEAQEMLLAIHKNMEAGLTKGQTEVADLRKRYNAIDSFFESFQQTYLPDSEKAVVESAVMNALPNVLGYYMSLSQNPVATLVQLAETYNATDGLTEALSGLDLDDGTVSLRRENDKLRKQLTDMNFQQTKTESETAKEMIDVFANEKTDDGVLKHPEFESVRGTMHVLMAGDNSLEMDTAYQKAVLLDKTDEVMEKREAEIREKIKAEQRDKSKEARKTQRTTVGKTGSTGTGKTTEEKIPSKIGDHLRDEMAKQLDDMEG